MTPHVQYPLIDPLKNLEDFMSKEKKSVSKKSFKTGKKLTGSNASTFRTQILTNLNQGDKEVSFDFNGLETLDSKGLGLLIAAYNSSRNNGGKVRIKNAPEKILKFMNTTRLDKYFEITSPG
jgi:anti-anti-sigma factor